MKYNTRNTHYDLHVEEYTGFLKVFKGWSGGMGRLSKVLKGYVRDCWDDTR